MRILLICLILLYARCNELLVTQARVDYLKKHATYEVMNYEDNIFKGWTVDEAKSLLNHPAVGSNVMDSVPPYTEFAGELPRSLDWRDKDPKCMVNVTHQMQCGCSWALALSHMLSERVTNNHITDIVLYSGKLNCCSFVCPRTSIL